MKSQLIFQLIEAHCSGIEHNFEVAINQLADDEDKKGKVSLGNAIRKTYKDKKKFDVINQTTALTFDQSNFTTNIPKDNDSSLSLFEIKPPIIKLKDIVLPESQYTAITQVVEEQSHLQLLLSNNVQPANRIILSGPPGCGKTTVANAIAGELGLNTIYVRLDGMISSYLGQTSTNLRKIFDFVSDRKVVLFLDEFDAIAKKRDDNNELGELKRVVTALLQNFDNLPSNVILIAATNHEHLLDPAIWRRFNKSIYIDFPSIEQRRQLIYKWLHEIKIDYDEVDVEMIAKITEGISGALIKELIHTATKKCIILKTLKLTTDDFIISLADLITSHQMSSKVSTDFLKKLNSSGVSLRALEKLFKIPKSTISYKIKEESDE